MAHTFGGTFESVASYPRYSAGLGGTFESGGSSSSRSPVGLLGPASINTLGMLGSTLSPRSPNVDAKAVTPAAVAVTVLQPVLPEDNGQPLLGLLTDQVDQIVRITSWPALRLPFKIHHGSVLTLRLFRYGAEKRDYGSSLKESSEVETFVAGIQVPVGLLMSHGAPVQCWCALQDDLGASNYSQSYPSGPAAALEAFETLRHRATYDVDLPKAFIALRPLRLDQVPSSPPRSATSPSRGMPARSLLGGSPMTPMGDDIARLMALAREDQQASPASGAFGSPLSPRALALAAGAGVNGRDRDAFVLRTELQAERSHREAEIDGMNKSMSELYQMLEAESAAVSKWQEDSLESQVSWCRDRFQWREELETSLGRSKNAAEPMSPGMRENQAKTEVALKELTSELHSLQRLLTQRDGEVRAATEAADLAELSVAAQAANAGSAMCTMRTQLRSLRDEVSSLEGVVDDEKSRADIEARHAKAEAEVAVALQDGSILIAQELQSSEEALSSAESRLASLAIPEAQRLVEALLKQEESHELTLSEVREFEAAGGQKREVIDGVRGELLNTIEGRVQMLQDEISQEREHFNYHTGHSASLEVQFEELKDYTEARDRQLEGMRYELEEQRASKGKAAPLLDAALQREQALQAKLDDLEQRMRWEKQGASQEKALREQCQKQLQDAQIELQASRLSGSPASIEDARLELPLAVATSNGERPTRPARNTAASASAKTPDFGSGGRLVSFGQGDLNGSGCLDSSADADAGGVRRDLDDALANQEPISLPARLEPVIESASDSPVAAARSQSQWVVQIDRTYGDPLGINLSSQTQAIDSIAEGGLFHTWNRTNPKKAVRVGDRILDVNGKTKVVDMVGECQEHHMLNITVHRQADAKVPAGTESTKSSRSSTTATGTESTRLRSTSDATKTSTRKPSVSEARGGSRRESAPSGRGDTATQKVRFKSASEAKSPTAGSPPSPAGSALSVKDQRKPSLERKGSVSKRSNSSFEGSLRG